MIWEIAITRPSSVHTAICDFLLKIIGKTIPPISNAHICRFREFRLEFPTNYLMLHGHKLSPAHKGHKTSIIHILDLLGQKFQKVQNMNNWC